MKHSKKVNVSGLVLSALFLLLGSYLLFSSFGLPAGSAGYPGAGFFPRMIGIAVLLLAGFLLLQSVVNAGVGGFEIGHARAATGVVILTFVYLLLWGTGFFAVRTFVFVALFLRFLEQPWKTGITVSAVMTAVVTAAFKYGLHLSLE